MRLRGARASWADWGVALLVLLFVVVPADGGKKFMNRELFSEDVATLHGGARTNQRRQFVAAGAVAKASGATSASSAEINTPSWQSSTKYGSSCARTYTNRRRWVRR